MQLNKHTYVILGALGILSLGALQALSPASLITECVGKAYGTAGCPLKSISSSSALLFCGNGVVDAGEECDYGKLRNGVSNCTVNCRLLYCGDQVISPQLAEECEPESEEIYTVDPETAELTTEIRYFQPSCGMTCTVPVCDLQGNCTGGCSRKFLPACPASFPAGLHAAAGVSSSSVAPLQSVIASSSVATVTAPQNSIPRCGNSILEYGEQCDDGFANSNLPNARCRVDCTLPKCGDMIVDTSRNEQCDKGINNEDQPNAQCRVDCTLPKCGDGLIDTSRGEQCDDGSINANNPNAHCRLNCMLQRCGDGVVDQDEECDSGVGCSKTCTLPKCGDGVLNPGEQCDEGPNNSDNPNVRCRENCSVPKCGDGVTDSSRGEECDDGYENSNQPNGTCRLNCLLPKCGDGLMQGEEQCDDGTRNSDTRPNACRMDCREPSCGDSILDADEQCDNGSKNGTEGNACTAECLNVKKGAIITAGGDSSSPYLPLALPLALIGVAAVLAYIFRKNLHSLVSKVASEKMAASIDDIPLDEIEMPWHKW